MSTQGNFRNIFPAWRSKDDFVHTYSDDEGLKMYDAFFGKSNASRGDGLEEEEFADIEAFSQSKCVTPSSVTLLFSQKVKKQEQGEANDGTKGEIEKRETDVQEKRDANIAADATVGNEIGDEKNSNEDESWLVSIGEDSAGQ